MLPRVPHPTSVEAETTTKLAHASVRRSPANPQHELDSPSNADECGRAAVDTLFPVLYQELKRIARRQRQREPPDHTLNTTGLVHEVYLKLLGLNRITWQGRAHFLAVAAQAMRQVLVDYAVATRAQKRGGGRQRVSLDDAMLQVDRPVDQSIAIDVQLQRLEALNPRLARVVECRFFSGMSIEETAQALGSSPATVNGSINVLPVAFNPTLPNWQRRESNTHAS